MQIDFENYEIEVQLYKDLWSFRKEFYKGEDKEAYWNSLINEADKLSKKHKSDYLDSMLLVCIDDIEDRWKQSTGNPYRSPDLVTALYERLKKGKINADIQKRQGTDRVS